MYFHGLLGHLENVVTELYTTGRKGIGQILRFFFLEWVSKLRKTELSICDDGVGYGASASERRHSDACEESRLQHEVVRLADTDAFLL